ncbi:hypothetical protein PR048_006350 [Dryococelus australis]|uniref:Uncharacterized protein n=1 Tax=Dryococelus australis TaxID=614101 RepID=A0ABQ9IAR0_9NEOP|nr:hypothetical protein PR048_006350 [Dryococelus australis]
MASGIVAGAGKVAADFSDTGIYRFNPVASPEDDFLSLLNEAQKKNPSLYFATYTLEDLQRGTDIVNDAKYPISQLQTGVNRPGESGGHALGPASANSRVRVPFIEVLTNRSGDVRRRPILLEPRRLMCVPRHLVLQVDYQQLLQKAEVRNVTETTYVPLHVTGTTTCVAYVPLHVTGTTTCVAYVPLHVTIACFLETGSRNTTESTMVKLAGYIAALECKGGMKENPEKTRRPATSFATIPTCGLTGNRTRFASTGSESSSYYVNRGPTSFGTIFDSQCLSRSFRVSQRPHCIASARFVVGPDARQVRETPSERQSVADLSRRDTRGVYRGLPLPIREETQPSATSIKDSCVAHQKSKHGKVGEVARRSIMEPKCRADELSRRPGAHIRCPTRDDEAKRMTSGQFAYSLTAEVRPSAHGDTTGNCDTRYSRSFLGDLGSCSVELRLPLELHENGAVPECNDGWENPLSSGIVRHDSHLRKSGSDLRRGSKPIHLCGRYWSSLLERDFLMQSALEQLNVAHVVTVSVYVRNLFRITAGPRQSFSTVPPSFQLTGRLAMVAAQAVDSTGFSL